jgi:hypothetical protein
MINFCIKISCFKDKYFSVFIQGKCFHITCTDLYCLTVQDVFLETAVQDEYSPGIASVINSLIYWARWARKYNNIWDGPENKTGLDRGPAEGKIF